MNKEKLTEIISELVVNKITNVCDDISTNEFYEEVLNNYYDVTSENIETEEDEEEVKNMIGEKVLPFINLVSQYILENHVVKK